jgi:diketogulonate reductase-like aldo/keto reductase
VTLSRRSILKLGASAGAALVLDRLPAFALAQPAALARRAIPSTGEMLPVIGLGSVSTFNLTEQSPDFAAGQEVIRLFHELGGRVIDTAPGYPNAEPFIGATIQKCGIQNDVFLATKFNALQINAGSGTRASGGEAEDKAEMERQFAKSRQLFGRQRVDLEQIWNLGDIQSNAQRSSVPAGFLQWHLDKALEWKKAGLARYIGITTSRDPQYAELESAITKKNIDFVQIDLSIEDPLPEERLLPAARDNGVAVLINRPFGSGSLFRQASQRAKTLPPWAAEFGITTWAQYFLKYIVSHPAVTAAIPATNDPVHLRDNMGGGLGNMPDAAARTRMLEYWRA